jgi:hypothetical protein
MALGMMVKKLTILLTKKDHKLVISRWLGSKFAKHAATAEKYLIVVQAAEEKAPETATTAERQKLEEQFSNVKKVLDQARQVLALFHENLLGVSDAIHPFFLFDNSPNDAEKVAEGLEKRQKRLKS